MWTNSHQDLVRTVTRARNAELVDKRAHLVAKIVLDESIIVRVRDNRATSNDIARHPSWREKLVVATKAGILFANQPSPGLPHRYDFSADYLLRSAEDSLRRFQLE